jgi:hypothetical protein
MPARLAFAATPVCSITRRVVEGCGVLLVAAVLGGCGPAASNESGNSSMFFGLFKSKYRTTVRPELGGALKRETAFPAVQQPPAPAYPVVRNVSADAPPPGGTLAAERREDPPVDVFVVDATAGRPAVALVNTYGDKRSAGFWEIDGKRFGKARSANFDPAQSKWLMWASTAVASLPAGRVMFHLKHHAPSAKNAVFLYDIAADRIQRLGDAMPDWPRGLPYQFFDILQVRPDVALVRYSSEEERIGPQHYVNHFEHLMLFSPRHPDGLEIVTLGLDDGHVRRWGMVGNRLWLETADDRTREVSRLIWSVDLTPVL